MSLSGDPRATYHTSRWQRGVALLAGAGAIVFAGLVVAGPQPVFSWWTLVDLATTGSMMVAAAAYGLHARIEVFTDGLRKVRPLWQDEEVRFETVERVLLPMTSPGLMLFTDTGSTPAVAVDGDAFERFDQLVLEVRRHLPDRVEVEDPVGRLESYRGDDGPPDGADPED